MAIEARRAGLFLDYESDDFPQSRGISAMGRLQVTWDDILWAAVTVGRPNLYYVFRNRSSSQFEALFRWSLVRMALEQHGPSGSRLWRTDALRSLDPSEKGAVNYFVGMTFCKLFADKLLGTPWLLHLDVFRDQLNPIVLTSRSRPDFVGQETANSAWHAFESKGRGSNPRASDKAKAKNQAQRLVSVDGQNCRLHIGAITFFKNNVLQFYWRDPEPEEPTKRNQIELHLPEGAWGNHYEPATDLMRPHLEALTESDDATPTARIEDSDVAIGAHPEILPSLLRRDWQGARRIAGEQAQVFHESGYRPDGLIIKCGESWRRPFKERETG
jgi:hypothetical protein